MEALVKYCGRNRALSRSLAAVGVAAGIMTMFAGCGRQQSAPPVKPVVVNPVKPVDPGVPVVASFPELGDEPNAENEIQWVAALTLAEISAAAYDDPEAQLSKLQSIGAKDVKSFEKGSSAGLVAWDDRTVVIAFRGTQSLADKLTDIKVFGKGVDGGRMHRGFFGAVEAVYEQAMKIAEEHGAKTKKVWVTGHSLGGAMAAAFTYKIAKEHRLRPVGIVTFGQPLVMSDSLCQFMLEEYRGTYIRFVNADDPVARVLRPYKHSGARVLFKDGDYILRKPMVAVSAPAGGQDHVKPQVIAVEDDETLQLMTDEEFDQLEKSVKESEAKKNEAPPPQGVMMASASWDPFSRHYMPVYIDNLKTIGQSKMKRSQTVEAR